MSGSATETRTIRILFLIDSIWGAGGAETSLLRLVQQLPRPRYECTVLTFHSDELGSPFISQFPCPVEVWKMSSLRHWSTLVLARRLSQWIRRDQFDVVHTFFPASDLFFGPIAKLSGAKVLISSRRDMGILRKPWHRVAYQLLRGMYDQVHAVSEGVRQYAIQCDRLDPAQVLTVHNGVDAHLPPHNADIAGLRAQLGVPEGVAVVSMVSNVRRVKGIDVFLKAAEFVKRRFPGTIFLIAGVFGTNPEDTAYRNEVLQLRDALGLEQNVRFLGACTEVPALLGLSDVFVLPSRSEGFSNALLEAMASGVPCVATSVGGNPEVITDGETGFLVPSENPEALTERIVTLLGDVDLRRSIGSAAKRTILARFTIGAMADRVAAAYESLIAATNEPDHRRHLPPQRSRTFPT